jgi:hypothetical protein
MAKPLAEEAKFHSVMAKLLYMGKCGRPDILLPDQCLCTWVQESNIDDEWKLEPLLGCLQLTKCWIIEHSTEVRLSMC